MTTNNNLDERVANKLAAISHKRQLTDNEQLIKDLDAERKVLIKANTIAKHGLEFIVTMENPQASRHAKGLLETMGQLTKTDSNEQ